MKLNKLIYILSIVLFTVSCEKDFLETYPTATLSQEQVGEALAVNDAAAEGTLLGIYEQLYRFGSGGTGDQEDFGVKAYDMFTDILSGDVAHTGKSYNRQTGISELVSTVDQAVNDNYRGWRMNYRMINLANLVIDGLGGADSTGPLGTLETDGQKHTMGQALALRGYAYFKLINLYVDDISDMSKPVLPVYTSADQTEQPKSTLQFVYDVAISDLTSAETLLEGFARPSKIEINQAVVRGILAYTYGAMNDWPKCEEYAAKVVADGYQIMSNAEVTGGFNSVNAHEGILWGLDVTSSQELASLVTWWGFMDVYSFAYAAVGNRKSIDRGLYDQIRADDIRLDQFPFVIYGDSWLVPAGKFYYEGMPTEWVGDVGKRFTGPQLNVTSDAHYMRVAEMYLLHAEASYENGKEDQAKQSLKAVADLRIGDTSYIDALSGADLEKEIDLQTRIELFAEGKSYLLMKRQRKSITRGSNWLDYAGETFSHNDDRLTFEIPENEILFNPNITEQN